MGEASQAAMKLRRGSPGSDGKPGVSCMRVIQFAAPPVAKRHQTNFTHKDSLPQQRCCDDGSDEIPPPPLEGEQKAASGRRLSYEERRCEASAMARSAAGGVTASKNARACGIAATPPRPPVAVDPPPAGEGEARRSLLAGIKVTALFQRKLPTSNFRNAPLE
jgi:hypothetical protein